MQASSVIWLAFFLALITPFIVVIVAMLDKDGDSTKTRSDMPNYKAQHENYWRQYLDQ